ncbi:MAG: glycosyltransferase family 4 protein [Desulfobacterales bacterium]|nr:glycosyltransferase family 4 protein [Desulfobacterales bacterium]MBF0398329.1 glycosyltransferase family 4 protein [Desulfobacterales bacterium]
MKILLINYEYPPIGGGASNATHNIGKALFKKGHEVFVLTSNFQKLKGLTIEDDIYVYRCLALRKKAFQSNVIEMFSYVLSASILIPKLIKKYKIDSLIVFFSFPCGPLGLLANLIGEIPYIISLRAGDVPYVEKSLNNFHKLLTPIRRIILKKSKAIVANSLGLKKQAKQADPYFHFHVITNAVDVNFFKPLNKENQKSITKFMFAGRFTEQKNLFFLIKEINLLKTTVSKEFEVHIVGGGPLENVLKTYSHELNLEKTIFWHNWCDKAQLRNYLQSSDCFLNPSLYEGMPNSILEAMACGISVIASNVVGNDALVNHNETGFLFDLNKTGDFQDALKKILFNPDLSKRFGQNGRIIVEKYFSWERVADEYLRLITS